ncbi:MAG TPA: HAMP domain-containing sensor histidine kinase [Blastocatellia bacterium]|nr:HAMP domain-containing sensor histidine kinase [Blastocatellia bacterium]
MSHRTGLIVLAVLAVLLPGLLFSIVQYRSLADLESKTRVAVQESLRQTLQGVSVRTKEKLEALAVEALGHIGAAKMEQEKLDDIELRLNDIKQSHPEINLAFVVVHCPCEKRQFAVFAFEGGVDRVTPEQFKASTEARTAIDTFNNASLLHASTQIAQGALFEQSSCALFPNSGDAAQLFVFLPLLSTDGKGQIGFAGFTLRSSFLKEQLLPQTIREVLNNADTGRSESGAVITVLDENQGEVYASRSGRRSHEISLPFSPVLRQWKLDIGYPDTTVAALARSQFRQNLAFTLLALALLTLGLALMLRATRRELKLVEAKGTFVSNVSHELKTPLALIRLFGETLEMGRVNNKEEMREYGRIISRESSRLTHLINNILDFSRIEAGRRKYRFVETDINQMIEEVLQSCEYQLKNAGFEVTKETQPGLPPVPLDREAMAQAILNLLNNAIKYSADVKRIEVSAQQRGHQLAIEVTDYGIGIPRSEQRKIFEKFYRVSTGLVHDTRGSGLGLAIVRHIIDAHRGEIIVESAPGKGSRFTILLPIEKAEGVVVTESYRTDAASTGGYGIAENPHH